MASAAGSTCPTTIDPSMCVSADAGCPGRCGFATIRADPHRPDWQCTGYKLPTWAGPAADARIIPDLDPVCRVWLGASHFYSVSECVEALAFLPGSVLETGNAFYATLPDVDTGACPSSQLPVFRFWNPRGSSHRYTTQTDVRGDMLRRGFVSEGYGPDGVAMCGPNSSTP